LGNKITDESFLDWNAKLNLWTDDHKINFDADKEAARQYHLTEVNTKYLHHPSLEYKLDYLFVNGYYEKEIWDRYAAEDVKDVYKYAYSFKHRFSSFLGAKKFYDAYALKTFDGKTWLERFEDRVVAVALELAAGDVALAKNMVEEIITGRLQPATPTFANCGKKQRGERVSCFLLDIQDSMNSIGRAVNSGLQLSKRGGGVGFNISNIRELGAPIKGLHGMASGVLPVCKILDDAFSYANQLGSRQGAAAVYISVHHPDVMRLLDAKKENADEKSRLKTLSIGLVVTDKAYHLAKAGEDIYQFSPYDVEKHYGVPFSKVNITEEYDNMVNNSNIRKTKVDARELFQEVAKIQFESGYPYILNIDTVNRANPIHGTIDMSNLCSEIVQVSTPSVLNDDLSYEVEGRDISCNLASLNVAHAMAGGNLAKTVDVTIRLLTEVSDISSIDSVPSVRNGNEKSHSIGMGQFGLHQFFLTEGMQYGDENSLDFTNIYFMIMNYYALKTSNALAKERGQKFFEFEKSKYADPDYLQEKYAPDSMIKPNDNTKAIFEKYGITIPDWEDWEDLSYEIAKHGLYNAYLQAVPPTGSISYINGGTSSIHPAVSAVEIRKEGKLGRVYYATPGLSNDNLDLFKDAYELGPEAVIDVYAAAQKHVDQAMSLTLFYKNTDTTRTVNRAMAYAFGKGVKSLYYARVRSDSIEGLDSTECVSCTL
jgi:ribonucleoside-diphosphate reductase alpha chain